MPNKELNLSQWSVIAGPCAAESRIQIVESAKKLSESGVNVMRAGLWKQRTSPNSWQGVGEEGVNWMVEAREITGIAISTEVKDEKVLEKTLRAEFDVLWIGSRNAKCFSLLEEVGKSTSGLRLPIILKRGMGADLDEWLGAAEYITKHNPNVILCERGIKGFPKNTRNVLDLQTAKLAQIRSGLPVIIDVSHAAGRRDLVTPMAYAAKAAGFNGVMIEAHPDPDQAMTDANQQISLKILDLIMRKLDRIPSSL